MICGIRFSLLGPLNNRGMFNPEGCVYNPVGVMLSRLPL